MYFSILHRLIIIPHAPYHLCSVLFTVVKPLFRESKFENCGNEEESTATESRVK